MPWVEKFVKRVKSFEFMGNILPGLLRAVSSHSSIIRELHLSLDEIGPIEGSNIWENVGTALESLCFFTCLEGAQDPKVLSQA